MTNERSGTDKCPECYPNPPAFWRDAPMNEEIRKLLTYSHHAKLFYPTLTDALKAWGQEIKD